MSMGTASSGLKELEFWIEPKVYQQSGSQKQHISVGTLGVGEGEFVFVVPDDSTRRELLGGMKEDRR